MGTTAVVLLVTEKHLVVGNCGDSRAVTVWPNLCSPMIAAFRCITSRCLTAMEDHFSNICKEKMHQIMKEELMGVPALGESEIKAISNWGWPSGYITDESALQEKWRLLMNRVFSRTEKAALGICECGSEGFKCNCNFNQRLL